MREVFQGYIEGYVGAGPLISVRLKTNGRQLPALCRPMLAGVAAGIHYQPQVGDAVLVIFLEHSLPIAVCGMAPSFTDTAAMQRAVVLQPGETQVIGPTGAYSYYDVNGNIKHVPVGSGKLLLGIASGGQNVARVGDTITGSGSVGSGGGSFTISGTITSGSSVVKA